MREERSTLAGVDERQLVEGVRASDLECLKEIHRRHAGTVIDTAMRMGLDARAVEEVAAEAFVALWECPDTVVPPGTSLADALVGHVAEAVRHHDAQLSGVAAETAPAGDATDAVAPPSLEDPRLDPEERRALELAVQGSDYRQVALALGETEDAVLTWLNSALRKLSG